MTAAIVIDYYPDWNSGQAADTVSIYQGQHGKCSKNNEKSQIGMSTHVGLPRHEWPKGSERSSPGYIVFVSVRCGFWPLIDSYDYPCSSQSFSSDKTAGVSSRTFIVKNMCNSLILTAAFSFVCTSPLAVSFSTSSKFPIHRNSNPFCWSCASTPRNLQQLLFPLVQRLIKLCFVILS